MTIVHFLFSQRVRVVTAVRRGRRAGRRECALSAVSKRSKGDNDDDGDGRNDDHGDDGGE